MLRFPRARRVPKHEMPDRLSLARIATPTEATRASAARRSTAEGPPERRRHYPYMVVRIACRECPRIGRYRLAVPAERIVGFSGVFARVFFQMPTGVEGPALSP
jgi:hypothetical protein